MATKVTQKTCDVAAAGSNVKGRLEMVSFAGASALDFFRNSTSDANCGVASVLASSSMRYTLSRCATKTPGTSSLEASLERSLLEHQKRF